MESIPTRIAKHTDSLAKSLLIVSTTCVISQKMSTYGLETNASNVHLLLIKLSKIHLPVYTIHDCFAGTPNNMLIMEKLVKESFIDIYFKDQGYLTKLHTNFVKYQRDTTSPNAIKKFFFI